MNRRQFIKSGVAGMSLPFWLQYCGDRSASYPTYLNSDHGVGHLLLKANEWPVVKKDRIETVIIGGGMSGLTAAYGAKDTNYQLFELSDKLGGSVTTESYQSISFSQGAHYDLAYPEYYGEETLRLLEELDVIVYEPWKKSWSFNDRRHIIPFHRRQQCYENGTKRRDVIREGSVKDQFIEILRDFTGEMKLPTRLIKTDLQYLNDISFHDFLQNQMSLTSDLQRQIDYHMYDDYGGGSEVISALAGIHYFVCRPYYDQSVDLFSPPAGNDYFAQKIRSGLVSERLKTGHLVRKVDKRTNGYDVQIADIINKQVISQKLTM